MCLRGVSRQTSIGIGLQLCLQVANAKDWVQNDPFSFGPRSSKDAGTYLGNDENKWTGSDSWLFPLYGCWVLINFVLWNQSLNYGSNLKYRSHGSSGWDHRSRMCAGFWNNEVVFNALFVYIDTSLNQQTSQLRLIRQLNWEKIHRKRGITRHTHALLSWCLILDRMTFLLFGERMYKNVGRTGWAVLIDDAMTFIHRAVLNGSKPNKNWTMSPHIFCCLVRFAKSPTVVLSQFGFV